MEVNLIESMTRTMLQVATDTLPQSAFSLAHFSYAHAPVQHIWTALCRSITAPPDCVGEKDATKTPNLPDPAYIQERQPTTHASAR